MKNNALSDLDLNEPINKPGLAWVDRNGRAYFAYFHDFQEIAKGKNKGKVKVRVRTRWHVVNRSQVKRWPTD